MTDYKGFFLKKKILGHNISQNVYSLKNVLVLIAFCSELTVVYLLFRCGETGHVAINCSKTSEVNCYRCGESGHLARECTIEATA